jgi:hypothetical protein
MDSRSSSNSSQIESRRRNRNREYSRKRALVSLLVPDPPGGDLDEVGQRGNYVPDPPGDVANVADLARSKKGGIGAPLAGLFVPAQQQQQAQGRSRGYPLTEVTSASRDATSANKTVCT